jgi:hypothetical protein
MSARVKRITAATVAVAVGTLVGCVAPLPSAQELASKIPYTTQADATHWANYPLAAPSPTDHWVVEAHGSGQDVVAVFPTKTARAAWAQGVASRYARTFGPNRLDGDDGLWTVITSGGPWSLDDAKGALHGTIVPIGAK